jgi:hypothetical protein
MAIRLSSISPRELQQFREKVRRVKYGDIYRALSEGRSIQVDAETPEELERCRRCVNRWIRRRGISVQRVSSGTTFLIAPLSAGDAPGSLADASPGAPVPPMPTPRAARAGKAPGDGSWEQLMRPPDPPSWERLMGGEKKSP